MIVVVNPSSGGGRGERTWRRIEAEVQARWPHQAIVTRSEAEARGAIAAAGAAGETVVASASGDGGIHLALNTIMDPATDAPRWPCALGAVGLGSSNDFHKPRDQAHDVDGVPVALDPATGVLTDLGRVDFETPDGARHVEYFVLNSSLGAVAEGNARFNQPSGVLAWLKGVNTPAAIQWCSLETLFSYRNLPMRVEVDGVPAPGTTPTAVGPIAHGPVVALTTLGVLKRVHFAGDMRYDTPVTPDDGYFDVNLSHDLTRLRMVNVMLALMGGRFLSAALPNTHHWRARAVRVVPEAPAALELDGEVRRVVAADFRVVPRAIRLCGPSPAR